MAETCCVPNCNSGREISAERIAFFNIPENVELQNKWIEAIPKSEIPLSSTDMVCEKHFVETDIIRHYIVQDAAGKVVEKVAYDYPRLSDTAVPLIFPGFGLRLNEPKVEPSPQSASQTTSNALYDYMVMDMYSDIAADAVKGTTSLISNVGNHTQHKTNEIEGTEVSSRVAEAASENHPLLNTEAIQNSSSPVNGDILSDTAIQSTKSVDSVLSNDVPVTAEPVPIFVQPVSMFTMSDKPAADIAAGDDDGCCGCDDECCECDDCCDCGDGCDCDCDCDGCVLS